MHVPQDSMWRVLRKIFWILNRPLDSSTVHNLCVVSFYCYIICVLPLVSWNITNTLLFFVWLGLIYIDIVMLCILVCLLYFRYHFHKFWSLLMYFWSNNFVFEFTGISMPFSFPTLSYRFHFQENNMKLKMIWPPTDSFRPFSALLVATGTFPTRQATRDHITKEFFSKRTTWKLCNLNSGQRRCYGQVAR